MKKTILTLLLAGAVWAQQTIPAAEFQWPTSSTKVIIKNREVQTGWKDGVPHARYADVAPLLNLPPSEEVDINLAEALARQGYLITVRGGTIEAKPNPQPQKQALKWVPAAEFSWPSTKVTVIVKGRDSLATWVDGRPMAARSVVGPMLNLAPSDAPTVDLSQTLAEAGYVVARKPDGSIEAKASAPSVATGGAPNPGWAGSASLTSQDTSGSGSASGMTPAEEFAAQKEADARAAAAKPRLVASGYRYVADTGYIRAAVRITNQGGSTSRACVAVGTFVDWFGKAFAKHELPIPELEPGEAVDVTFFSLVDNAEQMPNGVIKADKYTCRVTFR